MTCNKGSPTEVLYSLQTFGIVPDNMPINSSTGAIKRRTWVKWISMRGAFEAARAARMGPNSNGVISFTECPTHNDVLLGRGRPIIVHRGNMTMRQAVQCRLERFSNTRSTDEKAAIVWELVQETYQAGGRFLKEDPGKAGWWVEVDREAAKSKVAIQFRDLKSQTKLATAGRSKAAAPSASSHIASDASTFTLAGSSSSTGCQKAETAGLTIPSSTTTFEGGPHLLQKVTGDGRKATHFPGGRQEFDSSNFDFLHGRKRRKGNGGDCFDPFGGCFH
jgi:hypothetical protein